MREVPSCDAHVCREMQEQQQEPTYAEKLAEKYQVEVLGKDPMINEGYADKSVVEQIKLMKKKPLKTLDKVVCSRSWPPNYYRRAKT